MGYKDLDDISRASLEAITVAWFKLGCKYNITASNLPEVLSLIKLLACNIDVFLAYSDAKK